MITIKSKMFVIKTRNIKSILKTNAITTYANEFIPKLGGVNNWILKRN